MNIKVIIGLGNPGTKYYKTRHNIGFRVVDALADKHAVQWQTKTNMELCEIVLDKMARSNYCSRTVVYKRIA